MNTTGKRLLVFTMIWVILVMILAQVYDNITGRGAPATQTTSAAADPTPVPTDVVASQLADLQGCVAADPSNLGCVLNLADLYYNGHQWPQAQTNYEQAVRIDPHNASVLLKLAGTYIYQSKFDQAIPTLQQASSLKPDSPEIHLLLGLALSKTTPAQMDEAVVEWKKVLQLAPGTAWATQAGQYISEAGKQ